VQSSHFIFGWLQLKIEQLKLKGTSLEDFENLRGKVLSFLEWFNDEENRNAIIKIMIQFKQKLSQCLEQIKDVSQNDKMQLEEL